MLADVDEVLVGHGVTTEAVGGDLVDHLRVKHPLGLGGLPAGLPVRGVVLAGAVSDRSRGRIAAASMMDVDPVAAGAVTRLARHAPLNLELVTVERRGVVARPARVVALHAPEAHVLQDLLGPIGAMPVLEGGEVPGLLPGFDLEGVTG